MFRVLFGFISLLLVITLTSCSTSSHTTQLGYTASTPREKTNIFSKRDIPVQKKQAVRQWKTPNQKQIKKSQIAKIPHGTQSQHRQDTPSLRFGPLLNPIMARKLINDYRVKMGLRPLKLDIRLSRAARLHAKDLSSKDQISHIGSDGSNPWDRAKNAGYNVYMAAENIGTGQIEFEELLHKWKMHPKHKVNLLLKDATHMGIALVHTPQSQHRTFWTLVVASSK